MDVNFSELPKVRLERMHAADEEALECYRVLSKAGANIVGELLKGEGTFYEWNHYPDGDIYDNETHSQYYYHAHREEKHGHFHTFVRHSGMPDGMTPAENTSDVEWPEGDERLSHLVSISMDPQGSPLALFTTNRWVTGENWYVADDVIRLLDRFAIDHAVAQLGDQPLADRDGQDVPSANRGTRQGTGSRDRGMDAFRLHNPRLRRPGPGDHVKFRNLAGRATRKRSCRPRQDGLRYILCKLKMPSRCVDKERLRLEPFWANMRSAEREIDPGQPIGGR